MRHRDLLSSSCALQMLLLLLSLSCRTSTALPLRAESSVQCAALFQSLLLNAKELLNSEDLCHGLIKSKEVTLGSAGTVQACSPSTSQNSSCVMLINPSFSENECVTNIMNDLVYYDAAIKTYLQSPLNSPDKEVPLLRPTLDIIKELRMNCSLVEAGKHDSSEEATSLWNDNSYINRQKMCKMMRGFHVRAITINRALGYISSGDHRK